MKTALLALALVVSTTTFAAYPKNMSWDCQETILTALGEGTLEMSAPEIIRELIRDWSSNLQKKTAEFGYCGKSEFFSIKVDKESCEILELAGGDSDGVCQE